jgi:hypothetical protein
MTNLLPLGLDVAKLKLNACLLHTTGKLRHKVFPNTASGFSQLSDWLEKLGVKQVHACMEATGTYGDALAAYLHGQEHRVQCRQPGGHQDLRAESPLAHEDRQSGCRTDRLLLLGAQATRLIPARAGTA